MRIAYALHIIGFQYERSQSARKMTARRPGGMPDGARLRAERGGGMENGACLGVRRAEGIENVVLFGVGRGGGMENVGRLGAERGGGMEKAGHLGVILSIGRESYLCEAITMRMICLRYSRFSGCDSSSSPMIISLSMYM